MPDALGALIQEAEDPLTQPSSRLPKGPVFCHVSLGFLFLAHSKQAVTHVPFLLRTCLPLFFMLLDSMTYISANAVASCVAPGLLLEEAPRRSGQGLLSPGHFLPSPWQSVGPTFTDEETEAQQGVAVHRMEEGGEENDSTPHSSIPASGLV